MTAKSLQQRPGTSTRLLTGACRLMRWIDGAVSGRRTQSGCVSTINFAYWAGGSNTGNQHAGRGPTSTATTNNTNPIDLYPGTNATPIDAPYLQWSLNDVGAKLLVSGPTTGGDRRFTVCVFVNPRSGYLGTPITITASRQHS